MYRKQNSYTQWAYEAALEFAEEHKDSTETAADYVKNNSFFLTATFDPKLISDRKLQMNITSNTDTSAELTVFRMFYIQLCKWVLGKHFNRGSYRKKQPFCFIFFDSSGTRYAKSMQPNSIQNLHIHGLVTVPSEIKKQFEKVTSQYLTELRLRSDFEFDSVKIEKFDESKASLKKVLSYSSKLVRKTHYQSQMNINDTIIFPEHRHEHFPEVHQWQKLNYNFHRRQRALSAVKKQRHQQRRHA